jgi:hypothetical protein
MTPSQTEFRVLRETIAFRGTVRMALVPFTMIGWAIVAGSFVLFTDVPMAAVFSLGVLIAGFEAIHALHVGVERIGRYLQVFYETDIDGPRWESTAMRLGPGLPGGGVDPLFAVLFIFATVANLILAFIPSPTRLDLTALLALHVGVIIRVVRARGAAARQRAVDLETFRAIRVQDANARAQAPGAGSHAEPSTAHSAAHDPGR